MLVLKRLDYERNMARFYTLALQPELFGGWTLTAEFGRIGKAGTIHEKRFTDEDEALAAMAKRERAKRRRGYS